MMQVEEFSDAGASAPMRRQALAAMLGGVAFTSFVGQASAQTASSVDVAPLQFALNLQYLVTNFLQLAVYGPDRQLPSDGIRGGELGDTPGVAATSAIQVPFDRSTRSIQARFRDITDGDWGRTYFLRSILRADAVAQKLIDYSPATFTNMFRLAGALGATETFNPYASPANLVLAAETLFTLRANVMAGILPEMKDDIARATIAALAANLVADAISIRSMLVEVGQARPELLIMADRLALWRDRVDGTSGTDGEISTVGTGASATTRIGLTDADGLQITRTPDQALNVLFMSSSAVTQGGFFPTGINGNIVRSRAN